MGRKSTKRNLIFFSVAGIIISTIFTFNLSNSRYMGQISSDENALAIPIITLSNNTQTYSVTNMLPGDIKEYEFSVSNVDKDNSNEVLMEYYFKINMETSIPLEVRLYEIINETEQEIPITSNVTEKMQMNIVENKADKITRNYKLKIIWNTNNNSYEYAGKQIVCNIVLEALQVIQ